MWTSNLLENEWITIRKTSKEGNKAITITISFLWTYLNWIFVSPILRRRSPSVCRSRRTPRRPPASGAAPAAPGPPSHPSSRSQESRYGTRIFYEHQRNQLSLIKICLIHFAGCLGAEAAADRRCGAGQPPPERHPDPADTGAPGKRKTDYGRIFILLMGMLELTNHSFFSKKCAFDWET